MKNIAVGKKLIMGFGAVILMIALILGLSTITSISRNQDLSRSGRMSELLQTANQMLNSFNLARVEIRTLFTSIDAEEEYNAAVEYLDQCRQHVEAMESLSVELGDYMLNDIKELRSMFATVEASINAVAHNDEQANMIVAEMQASGTLMANSMDELSTVVIQTILNISDGDTANGMERVENVIVPVIAMTDTLTQTRLESRALMLLQDTSVIPTLQTELDQLKSEGTAIRAILSTDEARGAMDKMLAAVEGFRKAVVEVEEVLNASDAEIASARQVFLELANLVDNYVVAIAQEVNDTNESIMTTSSTTMFITIAVGVVAALFSVVVALFLSRAITRPLLKMKEVMAQAGSTGNLVFSDEIKEDIRRESEAKDELGQSLKAFTDFVDQITYMADCLKSVAARDLTIDVRLLSDEDTMGKALKEMLDNLNEIFGEINNISIQVASSSHEVAVGAQTLAQGSTEQAATVQEISASVVEINQQMNLSSDTATTTANHGAEIGKIAAEGNEKMSHMIGSMTEINNASQAIGRVIKVIDDIAFQTNILALNAAVEAARAGAHGKGFAVVADEVRNLAAKSADAAKETAELISTNIDKTEQGLAFTHETAESLTKIIEGIEQTNGSLRQIAEQSQHTKLATSQVTTAIDQVSMVIQQNSATSEQSAAASEEMSSQAQVLQESIARFRLRSSAPPPAAPPPAAEVDDTGMLLSYTGSNKY